MCNDCDDGDFYQDESGRTSCERCPPSTQRYLKVLTASNRSACQCKNGAGYTCKVDEKRDLDSAHLHLAAWHLAVWQVITIRRARLGWCVTPSIAPFPYALHWFYKRRLMLGFAGVCEMYEAHWSVRTVSPPLWIVCRITVACRGCGRSSWSKLRRSR